MEFFINLARKILDRRDTGLSLLISRTRIFEYQGVSVKVTWACWLNMVVGSFIGLISDKTIPSP